MLRTVKIRQYLTVMHDKGFPSEAVLAGSGVREEMLGDPAFLMSIDQTKTVVSNLITLTGDQGIGLDIGRQTELVDFGLVGYVMMSASTVRQAVRHWADFSTPLVGMLIEMRIVEDAPDNWSLVITESVPLGFVYNFCVEELLGMVFKLGEVLTSTQPVSRLELSYPAPAHQALYRQHFSGPISFNARDTRIRFLAPSLDQPLRGNDKAFNELCARQCELLMRQIGEQSPLAGKIKSILMHARGHWPAIDEVAVALNVSPRTLRRHLQDEGLNYQQLTHAFREEMAMQYLQSGSVNTKEIAYLLGFGDTNSFRRAFKSWTGLTVSEYKSRPDAQPRT